MQSWFIYAGPPCRIFKDVSLKLSSEHQQLIRECRVKSEGLSSTAGIGYVWTGAIQNGVSYLQLRSGLELLPVPHLEKGGGRR